MASNDMKRCPQCTEQFTLGDYLKMIKHFKVANHGLPCPLCACDRFQAIERLQKHCTKVHKRSNIFACVPCAQVFFQKADLEAHCAEHDSPQLQVGSHPRNTSNECGSGSQLVICKGPFRCPICEEHYEDVLAHIASDHKQCPVCKTSCVHLLIHYEYRHPSQFCRLCRFPYLSERALQTHQCLTQPAPDASQTTNKASEKSATVAQTEHVLQSKSGDNVKSAPEASRPEVTKDQEYSSQEWPTPAETLRPPKPTYSSSGEEEVTTASSTMTFVDTLLAHLLKEFKSMHNKDLSSDPRALRRLRTACARIEETPATVAEVLLEIDNLYEGIDFAFTVTQALFSELWDRHYRSSASPEPLAEKAQDAPATTTVDVAEAQKSDSNGIVEAEPGDNWALVLASSSRPLIIDDWEVLSNSSKHSDTAPLASDPAFSYIDKDMSESGCEPSAPSGAESHASKSPPVPTPSISPRMDHVGIGRETRAPQSDASLESRVSSSSPFAASSEADDVSVIDAISEDAFDNEEESCSPSSYASARSTHVPQGSATNHKPRSQTGPSSAKSVPSTRFDCRICAMEPINPTTTMCGHLFCHECIIAEFSKNLKCPVCNAVVLVRLQVD